MAHGFSMTREDGLPLYADAFQAAGANVLVFDHRFLGDSGGTPRQRFRAAEQREDWRNAMAYARSRPDVAPTSLILWGYSFSGGHVTRLLSQGADVAAALVLCPFVDGVPRVLASPPRTVAWILPRALADLAGRHNLIPVTGEPGSHAAMNLPGEAAGFAASSCRDLGGGTRSPQGCSRPLPRSVRSAAPRASRSRSRSAAAQRTSARTAPPSAHWPTAHPAVSCTTTPVTTSRPSTAPGHRPSPANRSRSSEESASSADPAEVAAVVSPPPRPRGSPQRAAIRAVCAKHADVLRGMHRRGTQLAEKALAAGR